jgi:hypothetical protein
MKIEDFDKQMQQKLEDLNPVFNESDWIRLYGKMDAHKSSGFFNKKNSLLLLLLLFLLFGTWMSYKWNMGNQSKDEQKHHIQKSAILAELNGIKTEDLKCKELPANTTSESNNNVTRISDNNHTTDYSVAVANNQAKINSRNQNHADFTHPGITLKNRHQENSKFSSTISFETKLNEESSSNEVKDFTNATINKPGVGDHQLNEQNDHSAGLLNAEEGSLITASTELVKPLANNSARGVHSNSTALVTKLKPSAGLKPHKWSIGTSGLVTASHFNAGVICEVKTKNNIAFGTGIISQKYFTQDYKDQNEFTATNEASFTDLIRPRHSRSVSFSNIKIRSLDILLPLSFKYYYPLDFKYSLFANASMQLTLYSRTSLDFNYLPYDTTVTMNETDFDQASNSATLINHFAVGAGIQREFRNLNFQLSFLFQKNNNNQPQIAKQELAGQVSLFYKL